MTNRNWMSELPDELRNISIIYLAIPGSHNSMTYGITSSSKVAPDADDSIHNLYRFFPWFVRRWSKNQNANVTEQLELGIRYFDLRIVQKNGQFYYAHGLFAMEVAPPLQEICAYLDENRKEVVILDFQHFYNTTPAQHKQLHGELLQLFGSRLYTTTDGPLTECTLNRCKELGRQTILIYRRSPILLPFEFWPSQSWPTPWPNKDSVKQLKQYLKDGLLSRKPLQGYVSQCVLTPSGRYIAFRPLSSLRRTAKKVDKGLSPWINEQVPGPFNSAQTDQKVNVFIADFVNLKDGQFCNWVIGLNNKVISEESNSLENNAEE